MNICQDIFPNGADRSLGKNNMAIQLFGDRLYTDQALYEYLIEFLLVFCSPKDSNNPAHGKLSFHSVDNDIFKYYVNPRIGLKRFIFFERSKKEGKFPIDQLAYNKMLEAVKNRLSIGDEKVELEAVYALQDLLYGFAAMIKSRSWMAQSLLPIAPELIFPEAMPKKIDRLKLSKLSEKDFEGNPDVENNFDYKRRNFMARGGEVYYLHLLQGIRDNPKYKDTLENLLRRLLCSESKSFTDAANFLQTTWEDTFGYKAEIIEYTLGYIPENGYKRRAKHSLDELIVFLSNRMHPITKIELLSKGVVLQILRMMNERAQEFIDTRKCIPWIIDMRATNSKGSIMKLAIQSYARAEEVMIEAVIKQTSIYLDDNDDPNKLGEFEYISKAKSHTLNLFKRLGKEMQLIIPLRGGNERFSLSEDIVRFLVLSIVRPGQSTTFNSFLEKLYDHYGMVIGPEQYRKCIEGSNREIEQVNNFVDNAEAFQSFMKNAGFLRDLSDATAIVVNPYQEEI